MATTAKTPRNNGLNSTQRMTVRLALATGVTIVTLMGAQILGLQDLSKYGTTDSAAAIVQTQTNTDATTLTTQSTQSNKTVITVAATQPSPSTRSSRRG